MAISFISAASANANTVSITTPNAGDLILVFSYRSGSTTAPSLVSGYTSIQTKSGTLESSRLAFKISNGTETNIGTWTNATNVVCLIYRGVNTSALTNAAADTGTGTSVAYPALTLAITSGTSWVVGFAGALSALTGMNGTTTALTANRTNQATVNGLDTNGGVTSFAAQSLGITGSGAWIGMSLELQQAASSTTNTNQLMMTGVGT